MSAEDLALIRLKSRAYCVKFIHRIQAGQLLAPQLMPYRGTQSLVVGLARGGVAVAAALAHELGIRHDVLVVKKISRPDNPELAIGARVPEGQALQVRGRIVILTDDGAATGATMFRAISWATSHGAKKIIVALPVAPPEVAAKLKKLIQDVIILQIPPNFQAVGQFYEDFTQVTDEEVVQLLK